MWGMWGPAAWSFGIEPWAWVIPAGIVAAWAVAAWLGRAEGPGRE